MPADSALAPLVPADVDLRDFPYTPIFRERLFGSIFHSHATDSEWRAGVTLWLKSWEQLPAGSLPCDDGLLCRLAELGRDIDAWINVKQMALHGFVLCSDGRLYHPVIAETVLTAWGKRRHARDRKRRWRGSQPDVPDMSRGQAGDGTETPFYEKVEGKKERIHSGKDSLGDKGVVSGRGIREAIGKVVPIASAATKARVEG